jgi:hypothetical protein
MKWLPSDARYRTVEEARIVEQLLLLGWAYELQSGGRSSAVQEAREALNGWVRLGLRFRESTGDGRCFDPAEVMNFVNWAGLQEIDPVWKSRFVPTARNLVREFHRSEAPGLPPPAGVLGPKRFCLTLRREFNLQGHQPGARMRLRIPLPLEDAALRDLNVVTIPPSDVAVDLAMAPGRLEARIIAPPRPTMELTVETSFTAYPAIPGPPLARLSPAETELYTRPREGVVQVTPRVQALADELARSGQEPWTAVHAFWNFMLDQLTCGVIHYDELDIHRPADWVLETGWFDCQLGSALLVALCRAKGIPARIISGYLLYSVSPAYHYWVEVWVDARGWVPLDLACFSLSAGGRDKPWRDYFVGSLDYRMKTQCLPRLFTGTPSVRFPAAWYMLTRPDREGVETGFFAHDSGALVYRDQIVVNREASAR